MKPFILPALALCLATPVQASGPQCYPACEHEHRLDCEEVATCLLAAPRDCLDRDVSYFACDRKNRPIDQYYPKDAYMCKVLDGVMDRDRRFKRAAPVTLVLTAMNLNATVCPDALTNPRP